MYLHLHSLVGGFFCEKRRFSRIAVGFPIRYDLSVIKSTLYIVLPLRACPRAGALACIYFKNNVILHKCQYNRRDSYSTSFKHRLGCLYFINTRLRIIRLSKCRQRIPMRLTAAFHYLTKCFTSAILFLQQCFDALGLLLACYLIASLVVLAMLLLSSVQHHVYSCIALALLPVIFRPAAVVLLPYPLHAAVVLPSFCPHRSCMVLSSSLSVPIQLPTCFLHASDIVLIVRLEFTCESLAMSVSKCIIVVACFMLLCLILILFC